MEQTLLSFWCERIAKSVARVLEQESFDQEAIREIGNLIADRPHLDEPDLYNPPDDALVDLVEALSTIKDSFMIVGFDDLYLENRLNLESLELYCDSMIEFLRARETYTEKETVVDRISGFEDTKVIVRKGFDDKIDISKNRIAANENPDSFYSDTLNVAQKLFDRLSLDQLELLTELICERINKSKS